MQLELDKEDLVSKLPPEDDREADLILGVLFNGCANLKAIYVTAS